MNIIEIFKEIFRGFIWGPLLVLSILLIVIETFNIKNNISIYVVMAVILLVYAYLFYFRRKGK